MHSIVNSGDYEKAKNSIEPLLKKGEKNWTAKDTQIIRQTSVLIEEYENKKRLSPIPINKSLSLETDKNKISEALGFEPDLIELVEFKMYQQKLNQNALAEILNMPASKISQILNRKREPDVPFLKSIHEKLGIDGNYILETV